MRRRDFITFLGSFAAEWPIAARAQHPNAVRVIGVLTGGSGPDSTARLEVFLRALAQLGWTENKNVRLDIRRGGGDLDDIRKYAAELAARTPDVIVAIGGPATGELLQATHTVPIVFTIVPDPVASGFVASLSQPGGNATGFLAFEYRAGYWFLWVRVSGLVGSGRPLDPHDAQSGVKVYVDVWDQAVRPSAQCAKVRHGLCRYGDAAFNLDSHVVAVAEKNFFTSSIVLAGCRTSVLTG